MNNTFNPHHLARLDIDRIKGYARLIDFYQGIHWEGNARRGERRLTFNYTKVFIDKITSYLMSGLSIAVDPLEEGGEVKAREAELAIQEVHADHR